VVAHILGGLNDKQVTVCFEREASMALSDKVIAETSNARNELESYCLDMRSKVEDTLGEYLPAQVKSDFIAKTTELEDWLYDEGEDEQKSVYVGKLNELKKVGDAAQKREFEAQHREEEAGNLKRELGHWEQLADSTDEKYSHIEADMRAKVKTICADTDKWLVSELSKQNSKKKEEDPSITCDQIKAKVESVRKEAGKIMNKAKPPPPKPEPKKEEPKTEEAPSTDAPMEDAPAEANAEGEVKIEEEGAAPAEPAADKAVEEPAGMEMD